MMKLLDKNNINSILNTLFIVQLAFIFYFYIGISLFVPSMVHTTSMANTIKIDTEFYTNNLSYGISDRFSTDCNYYIRWSQPKRDEIVAVDFPEERIEKYLPNAKSDKSLIGQNIIYIKRVVAVGGDKLFMKDGYLYLSCHEGVAFMKQHFKNKEFITINNETYVKNPFLKETFLFEKKARDLVEAQLPHLYNSKALILVPKNKCFIIGDNRWDSLDSRYFGTIPIEWVRGRVIEATLTKNI